jgi:flagellar biosynthesis GTPase FlhF
MQVKRFFAADMRQAMKLVRDELGADAAIIGNRRIAGGVELTAALDYKPRRWRRVCRTWNSKTSCARPSRVLSRPRPS